MIPSTAPSTSNYARDTISEPYEQSRDVQLPLHLRRHSFCSSEDSESRVSPLVLRKSVNHRARAGGAGLLHIFISFVALSLADDAAVSIGKAANDYHLKTGHRRRPEHSCSTVSFLVEASLICNGLRPSETPNFRVPTASNRSRHFGALGVTRQLDAHRAQLMGSTE